MSIAMIPSGVLDLRGWILDDNNGYFASGGGTGIATGSYRFGPTSPMFGNATIDMGL